MFKKLKIKILNLPAPHRPEHVEGLVSGFRISYFACPSEASGRRRGFRACSRSGFSLIEMLISIAIFSFVMLGATSVLLRVVDANHKAQGQKTAIDNISLTLDSMVRNMRLGKAYQCGGALGGDCPSTPGSSIAFSDRRGVLTVYRLNAGVIEVSKANINGGAFAPITAPEITIDRLNFFVDGAGTGDQRQPRILIVAGGAAGGVAGAKARTRSRFDVEALVSQRFVDVP